MSEGKSPGRTLGALTAGVVLGAVIGVGLIYLVLHTRGDATQRTAAVRSACAANVSSIAKAISQYEADHDKLLPADYTTLAGVAADETHCPGVESDDRPDYVYIPFGRHDYFGDTILLFELPIHHAQARANAVNTAYEMLEIDEPGVLTSRLNRTTEYLATKRRRAAARQGDGS